MLLSFCQRDKKSVKIVKRFNIYVRGLKVLARY